MTSTLNLSPVNLTPQHLDRKAVIYIRQSSPKQVRDHVESQFTQRALVDRAQHLGWHPDRIEVFDGDLGQSASGTADRDDFKALAAEIALGHVGVVFGWQVSRLARNNAEWYQLLDLAALFDTLIGDTDGLYDPRLYNDRLLLGLKGTMSEAEHYLMRQRLNAGRLSKVQRGEYVQHLPTGLVRLSDQRVIKDPDQQVQQVIDLVFSKFKELGAGYRVLRYCQQHDICLPRADTAVANWAPSIGVGPPNRSSAASSPIQPMPAPLSTVGAPVIPSAANRGAARPRWCGGRWKNGTASSKMRTRLISAGTSSWPIRSAYATTLSAITRRGAPVAGRPEKVPPYSKG